MRSTNNLILLIALFTIFATTVRAEFTPAWLENNTRHLSYGIFAWIIPGISKFWYVSMMAYSYLAIMSGFGKQEKVVQFFNELTQLYMPMTGVLKNTY